MTIRSRRALLPHCALGAVVGAVMLFVLVFLLGKSDAQICGDANHDGQVTVSDAVQVLRAAAELQNACPSTTVCDSDGSGTVTVTDGVAVLRTAADLIAHLSCGTQIGGIITAGTIAQNIRGVLEVGVAPIPSANAPATVGAIEGDMITPGTAVTYDTHLNIGAATGVEHALMRSAVTPDENALYVTAAGPGGTLTGFYRFPLDSAQSDVHVSLQFATQLPPSLELGIGTITGSTVGLPSTCQAVLGGECSNQLGCCARNEICAVDRVCVLPSP